MQYDVLLIPRESELVAKIESFNTYTSQEPFLCREDMQYISIFLIIRIYESNILFILFIFFDRKWEFRYFICTILDLEIDHVRDLLTILISPRSIDKELFHLSRRSDRIVSSEKRTPIWIIKRPSISDR